MKRTRLLPVLLLLSSCAHLGGVFGAGEPERERLWDDAHLALGARDFAQAEAKFELIAVGHPETNAGRESLFYLAAVRLDPRNPQWDPKPAEEHLRRYLEADSVDPGTIYRRPEAEMLYQLARQLNMPVDERVPGLQPEPRVVTKVVPERVVAPARQTLALAAEVERLKRQVAERDAVIQQQKEELERIRKTLTGKRN